MGMLVSLSRAAGWAAFGPSGHSHARSVIAHSPTLLSASWVPAQLPLSGPAQLHVSPSHHARPTTHPVPCRCRATGSSGRYSGTPLSPVSLKLSRAGSVEDEP